MGAKLDKLKGRLMQIEGKLTGDRVRVAQGTAEKTKGDLEGAASGIVGKVKGTVQRAKDAVVRAARPKRR